MSTTTPDEDVWRSLHAAAVEAMHRAYAPYSHFPVGAAALVDDGRIVTGCNVENASYGLTICAERTAAQRMCAQTDPQSPGGADKRRIVTAVVIGLKAAPCFPCGACRQVLAEFCAPEMPVFYARLTGGRCVATTVRALLPQAFTKN